MRSLWLKAVVLLVVIWMVAGGIILWARNMRPTPETLRRYIDSHQLAGQPAHVRASHIDKVADQLNALTYEQRREIRGGRKMDAFFRDLTPDEQVRFLDRTLPTGFKQMMEAFNKMTPEKRKRFVEKTIAEMRTESGDGQPPGIDDKNVEKIIDQGLKSFYSEASAEVKLDFAPLIEEMQNNLQFR